MTDHSPPSHGPDTGGAFRGLIFGAIILFFVLLAVVKLTDSHFRAREAAEAAQTH